MSLKHPTPVVQMLLFELMKGLLLTQSGNRSVYRAWLLEQHGWAFVFIITERPAAYVLVIMCVQIVS